MKVNEIRKLFLRYFSENNHTVVKSSSLVPHNDPTLLFTNAGMNQFKNVFLGIESREYTKATSVQKCLRTGGKHNDLENVGFTARHHTFFEMLGNFSFGDYFKYEAIQYAWEFLTKIIKLDQSKLYVTVYDSDHESYDIWLHKIKLDKNHIIRIGNNKNGDSDNFWSMGDVGPCGPCTEIFYDYGQDVKGGMPGTSDADGDRYLEIWNCVFMQYNRDDKQVLHPLPKPCVDTGMGLERISSVMQNVHNDYEIDLFTTIINKICQITKCNDKTNTSCKIIADHIRAISFLIADGILPNNEGRGYVLRRILRRAIRHGYKLDMHKPFLSLLIPTLIDVMGETYSELILHQELINNTIIQEEEQFLITLDKGIKLLQEELDKPNIKTLSGDIAFKLYDTYGFPLDLTNSICDEHNISIDQDGFDNHMEQQKNLSRIHNVFKAKEIIQYDNIDTKFFGYDNSYCTANIVALYNHNGESVNELTCNEDGLIVLDNTVFYAESGGQIGDSGIINDITNDATFTVTNTKKIKNDVFGHMGTVTKNKIKLHDKVNVEINIEKRADIAKNHTATHLLHKALNEILKNNVTQKGSLVHCDYLRFDFSYNSPLTTQEIKNIEILINNTIIANNVVATNSMQYNDAINSGAVALFENKYNDEVRVVEVANFSKELCGGTHVNSTGEIGAFIITSETGIANGIRRIEAITGRQAILFMQNNREMLNNIKNQIKAQSYDLITYKLTDLITECKNLEKDNLKLQTKFIKNNIDNYIKNALAIDNDNNQLIAIKLENLKNNVVMELIDLLKNKFTGIIIIAIVNINSISWIVNISQEITTNDYSANIIADKLSKLTGGKGGGNKNFAKGGGNDISKLDYIFDQIIKIITEAKNN